VTAWFADPRRADRHVGVVTAPAPGHATAVYQPVIARAAVRRRQASGYGDVGVVRATLPATVAFRLSRQGPARRSDPARLRSRTPSALTRAAAWKPRSRGTSGGAGRRSGTSNGARRWSAVHAPRVQAFGLKRRIPDVRSVSGTVERGGGRVVALTPHQVDPLAP
jgi:hypothetical protein